MQQFFARMSPVRASRDLRYFFQTRERYEWGFLALAVAVTGFFVWAFFHDSYAEKEYKPIIICFEQSTLDESDAHIIA